MCVPTYNLLAATTGDPLKPTHALTPALKLLGWAGLEATLWIIQNTFIRLYFLRSNALNMLLAENPQPPFIGLEASQ